jgi:hypothetical protein
MKTRLVGAEVFHVDRRTEGDRQTDITKLILAVRNSGTRLKACGVYIYQSGTCFNIHKYNSAGVLNYTLKGNLSYMM